MASKIVSLLLQVKNAISPGADKAAESLRGLEGQARGLEKELAKFKSAQLAIESFKSVAGVVEEAERAFDSAQSGLIKLKTEFKTNKNPDIALALDKAKISASEAKKEWTQAKKEISKLDATLKKAGVEISNSADAEKFLADQIDRTNTELKEHNKSLYKAKSKFKQTGDAAEKSGNSIKGFVTKAAGLIGVTLVLGKIRDGFTSLAISVFKTGDQFELLSKRLNGDELKFIEDFARNTPLQLDGVAKAFIRLRAFGVDPTLGAMQALTDQNAALGGGQAELEGIINAVGQAWAKQKLQSEEILQLVERGVPAWDLLAKATGKTTGELSKLSEQGKLGRKEIKLLIEEIAKANKGEAAKAMSTLSGIVSNLKDDFTQFYRRAADNGALDSLKAALVGVRKEFKEMADDGRLDKIAASLSQFFTSVITWGQSAAKSLHDNFGAIYGTATIISNSVGLVFNTLQAAVSAAGGLIARAVSELADLAGFDEFAVKAKVAADALSTQFDSAISEMTNNVSNLSDGMDSLPKSFTQVTAAIAETKKETERLAEAGANAGEALGSANSKAVESTENLADAQAEVVDALEDTKNKAVEVEQQTDSLSDSADNSAESVKSSAEGLAGFFQDIKSSVQDLSTQAGAAFSNKLGIDVKPVLEEIESLKAGIKSAQVEMGTLAKDNLKVMDVTGINRFKNAVLGTQNEIEIAYGSQKLKFLEYIAAIESGEGVNQSFLNSAESSIQNMDLLGKQDLAQLRSALDSANQKLQQMSASAQNTLEGLQNELDSLQGNQDAIEQRDYERKRAELNAAIEDAQLIGNKEAIASYTESLKLLDRVKKERESQSKNNSNNQESSSSNSSGSNSKSGSNSSSTTINLNSPGGGKSVQLQGDPDSVSQLLAVLEDANMRAG